MDFYSFSKQIRKGAENSGFSVDYWDIRPKQTEFSKFFSRTFSEIGRKTMINYSRKISEDPELKKTKLFIVINPLFFSEEEMRFLCMKASNAKKILFLPDSTLNYPILKKITKYFDKCYSFEKRDCQELHLFYQPDFFDPECLLEKPNQDYPKKDIVFLGSAYPKRYSVFQKFGNYLRANGISYSFKMLIKSKGTFIYKKYFLKQYPSAKMKDFIYRPLSLAEKNAFLGNASAIVDDHFGKQTGLSPRTIETLITKKKLITTNQAIKDYDLYNENNIAIISENDFSSVTKTFLSSPFQNYSQETLSQYTLESFISHIFADNWA